VLVPLGRYCRSSPLVFSQVPRCQGLRGSQKYTRGPVLAASLAWRDISLPWSEVSQALAHRRGNGIEPDPCQRCAAVPSSMCASSTRRLVRLTSTPTEDLLPRRDEVAFPAAGHQAIIDLKWSHGRFVSDWREVSSREMDWTALKLMLE
jgi:hypothetical protein